MTIIQISLPDQLAHDAGELGLLDSTAMVELLQNEIRRRTFTEMLAFSRHLATQSEPADDAKPPPRRRK